MGLPLYACPSVPSPENYFLSVSFVPVTSYTCVWRWKKHSGKVTSGQLRCHLAIRQVSGTRTSLLNLLHFGKASPGAHLSPMWTEKAKDGVDSAEEVLRGEGVRAHRCTRLTPRVGVVPGEWVSPGRLWVCTSAEHSRICTWKPESWGLWARERVGGPDCVPGRR